jgi:hypothetical protein
VLRHDRGGDHPRAARRRPRRGCCASDPCRIGCGRSTGEDGRGARVEWWSTGGYGRGAGGVCEREIGLHLFLYEFWWLNCPTQINWTN